MKKSNGSPFLEEESNCTSNSHQDNRIYCFPTEDARTLVALSTSARDPRASASGSVTSDLDAKSKWQDETKERNADGEQDGIPIVNGLRSNRSRSQVGGHV
jgi:hypothetical protein